MATPTLTLYQHATAPEAFAIRLPANATVPDLSLTTAATIEALWTATGNVVVWTAAVTSATTALARVRRVLDGSETGSVGTWVLTVVLTVDGEERRSKPVFLKIISQR